MDLLRDVLLSISSVHLHELTTLKLYSKMSLYDLTLDPLNISQDMLSVLFFYNSSPNLKSIQLFCIILYSLDNHRQ